MSFNLFAQSKSTQVKPPQHHKTIKPIPCHWTAIEDKWEWVSKDMDNVLCFITGFDVGNELCWDDLAEYYYNIAPRRAGINNQYSYFAIIPRGASTASIKTLRDLKSSHCEIIGVYKYGTIGKDEFIRFPFSKRTIKR